MIHRMRPGRRASTALALLVLALLLLGTRFQADLQTSEVRYTGSDEPGSWSGRAPIESLELEFDDADLTGARLRLEVDPARFDSGNLIRDANARRAVFETHRFSRIVFVSSAVRVGGVGPDAARLPDGASRELTVAGELTMHGVTRTVEIPVSVARQGDALGVSGSFALLLSDYAMTRPSLFGRRVDDRIEVAVELVATLEAR